MSVCSPSVFIYVYILKKLYTSSIISILQFNFTAKCSLNFHLLILNSLLFLIHLYLISLINRLITHKTLTVCLLHKNIYSSQLNSQKLQFYVD